MGNEVSDSLNVRDGAGSLGGKPVRRASTRPQESSGAYQFLLRPHLFPGIVSVYLIPSPQASSIALIFSCKTNRLIGKVPFP